MPRPWSPAIPERAERVSCALNAGTVWVNCFFVRDLGAPFGGNGKSGIGREGGIYSFDFYCDIKNTVFSPTGWTTRLDLTQPIESERNAMMGEVVGAGLIAHVPTIVLPEEIRRELNNGEDSTLVAGLAAAAQGGLRDPRLRHRRGPGLALGDDGRVRRHRAGAAARACSPPRSCRAG